MRALPASLLVASLLLAGPALAQGVMTPGPMPPPPSASDALPRKDGQPAARKPAPRKKVGETEAPAAAGRSTGNAAPSYRERIDARSSRGGIQLEDDPRAVQPMLQNGRPGMGMRF